MKSKSLIFTSLIFALFILGGTLIFLFWRLGILKKEFVSSPRAEEIKASLQYLQNFSFSNLNNIFQNLPLSKIEIPTIAPEELGRESLF